MISKDTGGKLHVKNVIDNTNNMSYDAAVEAAKKSKYIVQSGKNEGRFKKTTGDGGGGAASRFKGCVASGKSPALCAAIGRKAGRIK